MIKSLNITQLYNISHTTIVLETTNPSINFVAGQYVELSITDMFTKETTRKMSIASSPNSQYLRFIMHVDSKSLFKTKLLSMQPGEILFCKEPKGNFVLPETFTEPIVYIAGGVGVTPFIAMSEYLSTSFSEKLKQVTLLHIDSHKYVGESFYKPTGIKYYQINFAELEINKNKLLNLHSRYYISGSPRFVVGVRTLLVEQGVPRTNIILDAFVGY